MAFRVALVLAFSALVAAQDCTVSDSDKVDCGYVGITGDQCTGKGCCWVQSSSSGVPWCYFPAGTNTDCFLAPTNSSAPFSSSEVSSMRGFFLANINIQGKGGVVAAPDTNTPGGSYYYHWTRDGALSMRALMDTTSDISTISTQLQAYVQWVLNVQSEADPNGIDIRVEPKYNLPNGDVYTGGWCRPQNDGPALQGTTLIQYAQALMAAGNSAYVKQYLWTGTSSYNGGAIKYDLDWVVNGYTQSTCDLWEEVRSTDFFWNRINQKKAMLVGAQFATQMGDSATATAYANAAAAINSTLYANHWNGKYVQEDVNRKEDAAVIVGFNDGYWPDDKLFAPTSAEVAGTISTLNTLFCESYTINTKDTSSSIPGVLYGRYQGDTYAGGNPWILTTGALGQLLYRGATAILQEGMPSEEAMVGWKRVFGRAYDPAIHNTPLGLSKLFASSGDGPLWRLRAHVAVDNFHLQEQIDRNTGVQTSAHDLTWSYAEVLKAMNARTTYLALARAMYPEETSRDSFFEHSFTATE